MYWIVLENLEELVILSDNVEKNLVLKKNLLKLTKLKRIEIPIDFSQNSEILTVNSSKSIFFTVKI